MRYTHNAFDMSYKATIGVDFEVEKYSILDIPFTLQMWDTGNVLESLVLADLGMVRVDRHGFEFTQIKDHIIMQLTIFPLIYVQYFTVHIVWSKRHYRFKCLYNIEFILTYLWRWRTLKNQQRIFEFWTLRIPIGFVSKKLMQLWAVFKRSGFGSIQSGFVF